MPSCSGSNNDRLTVNYLQCLLFALLVCFPCSPAFADKYVISTGEYENLEQLAIYKTLMKAYELIGQEVQVESHPWRRSLSGVNQGLYDAELARISGLENQFDNLRRVTESIGAVEVALVYKKNLPIRSVDDTQGMRLGRVNGVMMIEKLLSENAAHTIVNDHESLFKMITRGRIDVGVCVKELAERMVNSSEYNDIVVSDFVLHRVDLYHYVHKKHSNLVPALEQAFKSVKNQ